MNIFLNFWKQFLNRFKGNNSKLVSDAIKKNLVFLVIFAE